jgi:phenylalanyl-tRNA synthetase beta chain
MKVSYEWLKELLTINEDPKVIAERFTLSGLEVAGITKTGIGSQNVVCVEILKIEKHPNADNLFLTEVDAGNFGKKAIITNVKGLQAGQKVLAALEGVKLANGMEIKKTKLKGIESEGMFVGWEELGFGQKSESLFFLDKKIQNGTNYNEIMNFDDYVIEIELTSNRGDCLGMMGIVREVKAQFGGEIKEIKTQYKTSDKNSNNIFKVDIKTPNCLRYCGAVIEDVVIKPSPYWMQARLIKAGIRPINNIVDITNYILLEFNQPLHAFDMDKIKDHHIIVRNANDKEKLTTLDGVERILDANDIVIADPSVSHCMGGIMGGQISEVSDNTKNIFLEAAFFKPETIRKTSKKTGLKSESSYRFERSIDMERVDIALKRALYLFDLLEVGKICKGIIDVYPNKFQKRKIETTFDWINNKLGTDISIDIMSEILKRLDFELETDKNTLKITVPTWRNDVVIKEDIAEEIARIYGYNNIKPTHYPSYQAGLRTFEQSCEKALRELMYKIGCDEMINFSLYGKNLFDKMLLPENHFFRNIIYLDIPLSEDWAGMRNSLIPGMLKTASFNYTRQIKSFAMFEIGNISINIGKDFPYEEKRLGIIIGGQRTEKDHTSNETNYDYYDIKGMIDCISDYFKINPEFKQANEIFLHPYQQAKIIINGTEAGIIGKIHPNVSTSFDIYTDMFIAEISLKVLFDAFNPAITYKEIPKFPSSVRDLSLIVDNEITSKKIIDSVYESNIEILQDVRVFDKYAGGNIHEGKYSIAIKLIFNKITSTLTDAEIDKAMEKILVSLKNNCKAEIRK